MLNLSGDFFSFLLECLWSYAETMVTDTSMALDMLRVRKDMSDQFDLVISDLFMPDGINDFKLLELIGLEMDIPVISKALAQTHPPFFCMEISPRNKIILTLKFHQGTKSNTSIPFDVDDFEEIVDGEMTAPSPHLPLLSHELAHQPSDQIQSSSAILFNQVAPSNHLLLQSPDLEN
jgi:CheY-like chemotaxis protein